MHFALSKQIRDWPLCAHHLNSGKDLTVELAVREAGGDNGG